MADQFNNLEGSLSDATHNGWMKDTVSVDELYHTNDTEYPPWSGQEEIGVHLLESAMRLPEGPGLYPSSEGASYPMVKTFDTEETPYLVNKNPGRYSDEQAYVYGNLQTPQAEGFAKAQQSFYQQGFPSLDYGSNQTTVPSATVLDSSPFPDNRGRNNPTLIVVNCPRCGQAFTGIHASGNLTRHRKSKLCASPDRKEYTCKKCDRKYQRSDALLNHTRKAHGASEPPASSGRP